MKKPYSVLALAAVLSLAALPLAAQAGDPLAEVLFPPELVMRHQAEIGLTDAQRAALTSELQAAQAELVPLQMEMGQRAEHLLRLLEADPVDELEALAAAEAVMELEAAVKRRHLALAIRIRNGLSAEQRSLLDRMRPGR